ncbi:hypothetical protein Ancab_022554 [Ancistrocladus abbreviatus]
MFGNATDETPEFMPLSHVLASKLGARLTETSKSMSSSLSSLKSILMRRLFSMSTQQADLSLEGPHGDAGLTGRKIIIDTYGGRGAHGGGAFSGKDPTKVDRTGAYVVKQAAKRARDDIAIDLVLNRGGNDSFLKTGAYGHFGREEPDFTWEVVKLLK